MEELLDVRHLSLTEYENTHGAIEHRGCYASSEAPRVLQSFSLLDMRMSDLDRLSRIVWGISAD